MTPALKPQSLNLQHPTTITSVAVKKPNFKPSPEHCSQLEVGQCAKSGRCFTSTDSTPLRPPKPPGDVHGYFWMLMVNLHHQIAFGDISLMILYSLDSSPRAPHCFGCLMGDFLSCGRKDSSASLGRPNILDIPCEFQVQETTEILRFSINTMD